MNNRPYNNDYETESPKNDSTTQQSSSNHSQKELDSIEYITPIHKKHKKKKRSKNADNVNIPDASEGFVFARPVKVSKKKHKKNRKKKILKVLLVILCVILSILLIAAATVFTYREIGKSEMHNYDDMVIDVNDEQVEEVSNNGKSITYKGKNYTFNEDVTSVVFMGIDKNDLGTENSVVGTGGQADAIYIAVLDTKNNKTTILSVSRDAMVDTNIYNTNGDFVNTQNMQLCLSYAYGDGKHTSAQNTITSLERLFYGLQFDTYFSMDYEALQKLNDAIGGVTVTTNTDFYSHMQGRTIKKGETLTLYGKDAENYIRARDLAKLDSNEARMQRQREYITSFMSSVIPAAKKDLSVITKLYNTVSSTSTTNLSMSKVTYLATTMLTAIDSYQDIEFASVPGNIVKGEAYAEFHVDEDGLMDLMLELFYEEQK